MEVNSGAAITLISELTFRKLWPKGTVKVQREEKQLHIWSGQILQVLGKLQVDVLKSMESNAQGRRLVCTDMNRMLGHIFSSTRRAGVRVPANTGRRWRVEEVYWASHPVPSAPQCPRLLKLSGSCCTRGRPLRPLQVCFNRGFCED